MPHGPVTSGLGCSAIQRQVAICWNRALSSGRAVAIASRESLIASAAARLAGEGQQTKMEPVYAASKLRAVGYGKSRLKNKADPTASENRRAEVVNLAPQGQARR
jgi:flagellar motor protein MotB